MNFSMIRNLLGQVIKYEAILMGLSLIVSLIYGEYKTAVTFGAIIAFMLLISFV